MNHVSEIIERKYQVFISSTFRDLAERRKQTVEVIVDRGHIPVALERYPAAHQGVPDVIKRTLTQCQLYILIVGHRYGSMVPGEKKSFVELEYEQALATPGLKLMTFVMNDTDVASARADLMKSHSSDDNEEIQNERMFQDFRKRIKDPTKHFYRPFRADEPDFKYQVLAAMHEAERAPGLRGWVREPEADKLRGALTSISRNRFIVDIVEALSALDTLDYRVAKDADQKDAVARCFADLYLQRINEKHVSLFLESGSTLAYVADRVGNGLSEARLLDEKGVPHIGVSTNNVLAYLILWLRHRIPSTLFPWGTPEARYGASLGCLSIDITHDPDPTYPAGHPNETEVREIRKLAEAAKHVPKWGANTLLLGATSGLQLTGDFTIKPPAHFSPPLAKCRGPHVGSYKNKLFKRFMYESHQPLMLFLTANKIDCEIEIGKCHFVFDDEKKWEKFTRTHPLALCIGCERKDVDRLIALLQQFGFEARARNDESTATAFIARNKRFIEDFEKPNDIV